MATEAEKALERVRKMLALSKDKGATEGERDNALRMAHATLAKYNLTMAEAEADGGKHGEKRDEGQQEVLAWPWMRHVQYAVAKLFFCVYYYSKSQRKNYSIGTFVGRESNVETAKEISAYVIQSITKEANQHRKNGGDWLSFCKGAANRIVERCDELRDSAEKQSNDVKTPGTAIVLASFYQQEEQANRQFLATIGVNLVTSTPRKRKKAYASDFAAGRQHGDKINLNRQVRDQGKAKELPY